jgi:hypothetical protein
VGARGAGCKSLITVNQAPGSGIMGDGSIDGRGGAKLVGQEVTWWDLAKTAKIMDQNQSVPRLISVRQSNNFTLYRITLHNSPNFHARDPDLRHSREILRRNAECDKRQRRSGCAAHSTRA